MLHIHPADHARTRIEVHPSQRQPHVTPVSQRLHVATAISNPCRYRTRYELYRAFAKYVEDSGAILYTVELALRDRHFEVTSPDNPRHLQLRAESELWHKENLLNLMVARFDPGWHYGAYIDADFAFTRPDWMVETIHQLQHYRWVQMFSTYLDLDRHGVPYRTMPSFAATYRAGNLPTIPLVPPAYYGADAPARPVVGATGGAWAFRREAFDAVGRLLDTCILGSADWHMAFALAGHTNWSAESKRCTQGYIRSLEAWCRRARGERGSIGVVDNCGLHHWHGNKANRAYGTRWSILLEHDYDPVADVKYDWQGVLGWTGNKPALEEAVRQYFRDRDEDATS